MGEVGSNMSTLVKELLKNYYNADDNSKLDLDMAVKALIDRNELSEKECIILKLIIDQVHYSEISKAVGWKKSAINDKINRIAEKIANYLGAEYQDEKIIRGVKARLGRELTSDEEKFCWGVIRVGRSAKGVNIFNFKEHDAKRRKDKAKG